jgi:RNA polymerase sigma-70 factor (ECF subfamily)
VAPAVENKPDIVALVHRARSGDPGAYRVLCERLAPAVRAYAQRRLRHRAAVEDLTQDALLTFVEALKDGRIEEPARAASFALGICHNLARERARGRDRRQAALERFGDFSDVTMPDEPTLLNRARLEDCLSQLTGRARQVLLASYCEELTDGEIATAMEIGATNVRVIRHRSIVALRECVETARISWGQR